MSIEDLGINSDFKEAIVFAILGYLRIKGIPGNLPQTTGADKDCLLGTVFD